MSSQRIVYLSGVINWAKVDKPDTEYDVYTLDLYLDDESWMKFDESGLQLKRRVHDTDGEFIKLRRSVTKTYNDEVKHLGPPQVLLEIGTDKDGEPEYEPLKRKIGNGSTGVCKVRVYDTTRGKGHELVAVAVTDLVEYDSIEGDGEDFPF